MTLINWIMENKEWLFSGMGVSLLSFFFGRKSISKNEITVTGKRNRSAINYSENKNTTNYINSKFGVGIDYNVYLDFPAGETGTSHIMPDDGALLITAFDAALKINNMNILFFSSDIKQTHLIPVSKKDKVIVEYSKGFPELRFLYLKGKF